MTSVCPNSCVCISTHIVLQENVFALLFLVLLKGLFVQVFPTGFSLVL